MFVPSIKTVLWCRQVRDALKNTCVNFYQRGLFYVLRKKWLTRASKSCGAANSYSSCLSRHSRFLVHPHGLICLTQGCISCCCFFPSKPFLFYNAPIVYFCILLNNIAMASLFAVTSDSYANFFFRKTLYTRLGLDCFVCSSRSQGEIDCLRHCLVIDFLEKKMCLSVGRQGGSQLVLASWLRCWFLGFLYVICLQSI